MIDVNHLVKQILLAKVYDVASETPMERAPKLSQNTGASVYLKREDLQPVHSFKLRGAYNKMVRLPEARRAKGVIAASAGNHAQGVALSAQKLGVPATIFMPKTTPSIKVEAVKSFGANIVLLGDSYTDAYEHSQKMVKETGQVFIHPFDDVDVIAGQGTVGREILEQLPRATHVFVPVGGGGLIAGVAAYIKQLQPDIKIIGVEPEDSQTLTVALKAGKPVSLPHVGIFADGVAVKRIGDKSFEIAKKFVDEMATVGTDQMCAGIKAVFEDTRSIVEPAGALATAAIMHYNLPADAQVVAICSGANVTFERLQQIAERTLIGSGKEALFAVAMPERTGALQTFCNKVVNGHNITAFSYRLNKREQAHVLVNITVSSAEDKAHFMQKMQKYDYDHTDLSNDDIAKEHIRHMIGGPAPEADHEHFYEVEFPERPGALGEFLAAVSADWNISAFHYRSTASDTGNVLVGFETPNKAKLEAKLNLTHHGWKNLDKNKALQLFTFDSPKQDRG
jgi:threonine dehydratase